MTNPNFAKAIKRARTIKGYSQAELAAEAKVNQTLISKIEAGKRNPSKSVLDKILNALNLTSNLLQLLGSDSNELKYLQEKDAKELTALLMELIDDKNENRI